ncbi:MAG: hypothetical protein ABJ360_22580 [Roseobacter sp.]
MSTTINRRSVLSGAPVALTATVIGAGALTSKATEIQRLFINWSCLTDRYQAIHFDWEAGIVDDDDFERTVDTVLNERDSLETAIFKAGCENIEDLRIMTVIANYFDWNIRDYNAAVSREAALLASSWMGQAA